MPSRVHLGQRKKPKRPNQHVHFDWYTVGASDEGFKYLLVIRDAFSRFVMLVKSVSMDAANSAKGLMEWIAIFGLPEMFFSDNGSHFRNKVMESLARLLPVTHEFSTVYCAWSNGLVERVNRDIKVLIKIFLMELRRDMKEWPQIVMNIMSALNQRPSAGLAGHAPTEVHCGMKPTGPLDLILSQDEEDIEQYTWTQKMEIHLATLNDSLNILHSEVTEAKATVDATARRHPEILEEFEIGDFVIFCKVDRVEKPKKHDFMWTGPFQVMDIKTPYVYMIRDIVLDRIFEAHVTRLQFYSTVQLNEKGALKDLVSRQGSEMEVEKIMSVDWDGTQNKFLVKTKWRGLSNQEISFEPFEELFRQIPRMMLLFLDEFAQKEKELYRAFWRKKKSFILKCVKSKKIVWTFPEDA